MDTFIYELDAGQTLHLAVRHGDALRVQRGQLVAQPRAEWLGGTLLTRRERWSEAHGFENDAAQHWSCVAVVPSTVLLQRRRGLGLRLADAVRWLGGAFARFRRLGWLRRFSLTGTS